VNRAAGRAAAQDGENGARAGVDDIAGGRRGQAEGEQRPAFEIFDHPVGRPS